MKQTIRNGENRGMFEMKKIALAMGVASLALIGSAQISAQETVTTPEGALLQVDDNLAYKAGELSEAQLMSSTRHLFNVDFMNVFRRFPRDKTADMVRFYVEALGLRSLNPIQLTSTQQMILTGVGGGQIKLSAGQPEGRNYQSGGIKDATGLRMFRLSFPSEAAVLTRFGSAGISPPIFMTGSDGSRSALMSDPGGFSIQLVIDADAKPNGDSGVGIGINVSDIEESRAFYREFVGLDELPTVKDSLLGVTFYPYRNGESTILLYQGKQGIPADNGSAGIQYVVSDAAFVDAKAKRRDIGVQTPLNKLRGFDLTTIWLSDPDGVTNYFAQVGPNSRTAQAKKAAESKGVDLTTLPPIPMNYAPAQTSWGEPDIRGGWPIDHLNGTPFERPEEFGKRVFLNEEEYQEKVERLGGLQARYDAEDESDTMGMGHWSEMGDANRRTSFLTVPANGRLPAKTEQGQRNSDMMRSSWRTGQSFNHWTDFDSWDRCITRGLPTSMFPGMYNNGIRIFQSPGMVAMQLEMIHEVRLIPTDGRSSVPAQIGHWMGESRGHWENGNTLVIETTNLRPGPSATSVVTSGSPRNNDSPVSYEASLTERLTMTDDNSIVYEMLFTDPVNYSQPWGARTDWQRDDDYQQFEYACHEGNVQIRNYITANRAQRSAEGEEGE